VSRRIAASALLAIVALTLGQGGAAFAHANYFRSSPLPNERLASPPDRILIGFSEAPDPKQSGIDLLAKDGHTVASGGQPTGDPTELALPLPVLDPATYLVAWHTVSAVDGDPAHGYFAFAVGPDSPATGSVTQAADASGTHATLTVSPARVGANEYRVHVADATGNPLANVTRVRLLITNLDRDLGTSVVVLPAAGADYVTTGMDLGLAGRFSVQLEVRRKDILDDLIYKMTFTVANVVATATPAASASASAIAPSPSATPASASGSAPIGVWVVAAGVIAVALLAAWAARRG
jgi:methionine-rich copper-binding protein CopC